MVLLASAIRSAYSRLDSVAWEYDCPGSEIQAAICAKSSRELSYGTLK